MVICAPSRHWQWLVDQLVDVKGMFGLRPNTRLTIPDVRYAYAVKITPALGEPFVFSELLELTLPCAGGELVDLQWSAFPTPLSWS
jgi:hypothetical protein